MMKGGKDAKKQKKKERKELFIIIVIAILCLIFFFVLHFYIYPNVYKKEKCKHEITQQIENLLLLRVDKNCARSHFFLYC